jgi:hypothetical protein
MRLDALKLHFRVNPAGVDEVLGRSPGAKSLTVWRSVSAFLFGRGLVGLGLQLMNCVCCLGVQAKEYLRDFTVSFFLQHGLFSLSFRVAKQKAAEPQPRPAARN